jgi:phosphoribosylformylglycinamidine synthase
MLWQVYVFPLPGQPDLEARRIAAEIDDLGDGRSSQVRFARGYLIDGELARADIERIGRELLADPVIESFAVANVAGDLGVQQSAISNQQSSIANVLLKPGVMDPVAQSVAAAIRQLGLNVNEVHTFRSYWIEGLGESGQHQQIADRVLANDAIEQVTWGPLKLDHLAHGHSYRLEVIRIPIRTMTDSELERVSRQGQLSLSLVEMQTIQRHFRETGRDPTDAELETIAQTWSEHCSHKTLKGRIDYEEIDADGRVTRREHFENMLKETIFKATQDIRKSLGDHDWCVSVFEDNAGIVRFDEKYNVCFKVETHNHPSAIEPYGGANTGVGGVIRDVIGTGLGAKPIASTDIFCFAPPDFPTEKLPPGVLHPKRVMRGVVAGVRDYGNRMGIPTVNGAIYFDDSYLGNPLVFCGSVGLIPRECSKKEPKPGDLIVAVGGRTGRDGIHGATFSSIELTHESDELSGGAVQIGNAITEKMLLDVILAARERGLYNAITDCGAGGFSSAVGEMGERIGAEVRLERVPLKYQGLSYTEIWISEAQERMVLAVPERNWHEFELLCKSEGVEATPIGRFEPTGRLVLKYEGHVVGDLDMKFLHDGRPPVVRKAVYKAAPGETAPTSDGSVDFVIGDGIGARTVNIPLVRHKTTETPPSHNQDLNELHKGILNYSASLGQRASASTVGEAPYNDTLRRILSSWNVCSKEWVIRQYDHEVQGGSVIKPLVGAANDGPSDAAVIRPVLDSNRGLAIACGMNPRYGDLDPYWMAASAIDEAIRNCVAVGADPDRIAILDNFCWGNTDRPEELGKLVRAALGCRDIATAFGTPFISGKDSLNNEFKLPAESGERRAEGQNGSDRIVIPPTLLISAIGQIDDVRQCVTMDLKEPGNRLFLVGSTADELAGSHFEMYTGKASGKVPKLGNTSRRRSVLRAVFAAIQAGFARSCHDVSEGGLVTAAAEMALAGNQGLDLHWAEALSIAPDRSNGRRQPLNQRSNHDRIVALFSESNTRFLVEVHPRDAEKFEDLCAQILGEEHYDLLAIVGDVLPDGWFVVRERGGDPVLFRERVSDLKECWQRPIRW